MKFVLSHALCPEGMDMLAGTEATVLKSTDMVQYPQALADADAVIVRVSRFRKDALDSCPKLRVIGRTGVGVDSVDVEEATRRGIPVVVTPGANSPAVAEHTVAFMFALAHNLVECHNEQLKGNYAVRDKGSMFEVAGKTVLILGLGAVGSRVAALCRAVGMKTIGYAPSKTEEQIRAMGCEVCKNLHDALPQADFVTLHVPLNSTTRSMIGRTEIAMMKPGAMVINCARGGVIDESALADALNEGRLGGAGIDCFEKDPPAVDNPLMNAKNVIVSPHNAALTRESMINVSRMCVEGCMAVLRGEKWPHVANPQVYDHPLWKEK